MTSQHFWEMRIQKLESAPVQISKSLRGLIMSGKIAPGERIPSTRELAALLGSHVAGVHAALTVLVKEGLLFRVPGLGTFVRQREEKLTRVGVFGNMAVSYTHLDVYKRQDRFIHVIADRLAFRAGK